MIVEIATAAAMYWSDRALAAESDIPPMKPRLESCSRYHEAEQIRQCLDHKMQQLQQPDGDMWDPNWVSSITYDPKDVRVSSSGSAKASPKVLPKSHKKKS